MKTFEELGLSKPLLRALSDAGYTAPTEIQSGVIELILEGRDILASAQTGSGKTAAFALPMIQCLEIPMDKPRALVLVPTRELALQVATAFRTYGKHSGLRVVTLYGGVAMDRQVRALKSPVDIVVATPGRLLDCADRKYVDLSKIEMLVLDEADRLLDLGFMPQLRKINAKLSKERQTLMFSATIDERIGRISCDFSEDPAIVKVRGQKLEADTIEQKFVRVTEFEKDALLLKVLFDYKLLDDANEGAVLIFTRTKRKAGWVKDRLCDAKVAAEEIHGDISQAQRERTLKSYREGGFAVLVATDVAARGLDIPAISHVINYDLPDTPEDYVHRIGRTGRAGRSGIALSFISEEQRHLVRDIEKLVGRQLETDVPAAKPAVPLRKRARGGSRW